MSEITLEKTPTGLKSTQGDVVILAENARLEKGQVKATFAIRKGDETAWVSPVNLTSPISRRKFMTDAADHGVPVPETLLLAMETAFQQSRVENGHDATKPPADPTKIAQEAAESFEVARELLHDPRLLERIGNAIRDLGYAGDLKPPKLGYMAATSRLLERPNNATFVGPSASGKTATVEAFLQLIPKDAYHMEKAGSAHALVYSDADYQHKFVVVAEADSIPEDGPAASAVRSLASDNCMSYDVVEKNAETGGFVTRHIEKPGPTGLITTTTRPLGPQMDTRMLSIPIADTNAATQEVLKAQAAAVSGRSREKPDIGPFLALQRWLELAGGRQVKVHFAEALANMVPPDQVRMRRDFRQVLTLIQTCAFLHQRQRPRDVDGAVLATMEDYRLVRELVLEIFTAVATGGISSELRQTVEAVGEIAAKDKPARVVDIAKKLGLAKETAWYRVQRALKKGYLVNQEDRKGQPAKLIVGDPLPEKKDALPQAEKVEAYMHAHHPETHLTVQPPSVAAVECELSTGFNRQAPEQGAPGAVESRLKPGVLTAPTDSPEGAVKRLNGKPGEESHTFEEEL